nr:hypothetical protein [Pseudomonas viciae]
MSRARFASNSLSSTICWMPRAKLDRGQERGVPPSAIEDAIQNGKKSPGNRPGTTVHIGDNGVKVVTGERGQVITIIPNEVGGMDELIHRQFFVIRQSIDDYRADRLSLNSLIQRIEGAGDVISSDQWGDAVSMILLEMEQINADVLNAGTKLSEKEEFDLEKFLLGIEELIARSEKELPAGDEV